MVTDSGIQFPDPVYHDEFRWPEGQHYRLAWRKQAVEIGSYENDMSSFKNKDDILTALIHLGYLAYDENTQEVYIPNKEVQYTLEQQLKGEILS